MDINLPCGDGTKLDPLFRKIHMPVPISVACGNSGFDDKITTLGVDADGNLTKPCDRCDLVLISKLLSGALLATVLSRSMLAIGLLISATIVRRLATQGLS